MLDSGCTRHFTNSLDDYDSYTAFPTPSIATLANAAKTEMRTLGAGVIKGHTTVNGKTVSLTLNDVIYCPSISQHSPPKEQNKKREEGMGDAL